MTEPRAARPTIKFIDAYCESYRNLFPDVRAFEAFKQLHIGMISEVKRKTLPAIARINGLNNSQSLHHFITESSWSTEQLRKQRLELIVKYLNGRKIILIIDETGDRKAGKKTDYVTRQYIGKLGKIENGIVVVAAYGLIDDITFPITFEVYKPKNRLKSGDVYRSKPKIAADIINQINQMGFAVELVLADSLYGESTSTFIRCLQQKNYPFIVSIRSNHGVWLPEEQRVRANNWRPFERKLAGKKGEIRYIREIIFGKRQGLRYWEITTNPTTLPENDTWYVMSWITKIKYSDVGNLYGCRSWIEHSFNYIKNQLGWADFRLTNYRHIEKWWELVCSAYVLVSLNANTISGSPNYTTGNQPKLMLKRFLKHYQWNHKPGWKSCLNNLRLLMLPFVCFNLIQPWLKVFPIPQLSLGFARLIALINLFPYSIQPCLEEDVFYFSSA